MYLIRYTYIPSYLSTNKNLKSHYVYVLLIQLFVLAQRIGFKLASVGSLFLPVVTHAAAGYSVTLVMNPCPQTLWGRGSPQDMSMPGQ